MLLLGRSSFDKKLQSKTGIREKLGNTLLYKKVESKMLVKSTPCLHIDEVKQNILVITFV